MASGPERMRGSTPGPDGRSSLVALRARVPSAREGALPYAPMRIEGSDLRGLAAVSACALTLAVAAREADACSCVPPPPPLEALGQATAVFEARVSRVETDATVLRTTAHLIVLRQWKGDLPEDVTVVTASQGSLCGFPFRQDQRVLLYADGEVASMSVSMCSRSRPVEQAGEDLAALLDLPVSGPRRAAPATPASGGGSASGASSGRGGEDDALPPAGPRSGGCGGCGGASAALLGVALVALPRRRRSDRRAPTRR